MDRMPFKPCQIEAISASLAAIVRARPLRAREFWQYNVFARMPP